VAQFPGQEKDFDEARPPVKGCSAMRGPAWCSKRAYASSKIYTLDEGPPANAAYERRFFVEDDPSWRLRFVALYTLPLLLMAWGWCVYLAELGVFIDLERNLHILGKESMFNVPVPMVVFLAVALLLDAAPLWFVARDIVYASRDGVPVVDVDARVNTKIGYRGTARVTNCSYHCTRDAAVIKSVPWYAPRAWYTCSPGATRGLCVCVFALVIESACL